jgi:hypothetical protein
MSALGQKPTCAPQKVMSALPSKADICVALAYVRFGPKADIQPNGYAQGAGGIQRVPQPNYSGARALRNGMLEICIIPENG